MDNRSDNVCDLHENQEEKISKTHKRNAQRQKYSKRVGGLMPSALFMHCVNNKDVL